MTHVYPLRRARTTSSTATGFTAKVPTATEPTGAGVFDLFDPDLGLATNTFSPSHIHLQPFGTDGDNDTFSMRLWGWSKVYSPGITGHDYWVPFVIADLAIVLGNIAGIGAGEFLADTITITKAAGEDYFRNAVATANDTPGSIILHLRGAKKFEFDFDLAGAQEGVAMNCYWRVLDQV